MVELYTSSHISEAALSWAELVTSGQSEPASAVGEEEEEQ